jgi:hypothetical protein
MYNTRPRMPLSTKLRRLCTSFPLGTRPFSQTSKYGLTNPANAARTCTWREFSCFKTFSKTSEDYTKDAKGDTRLTYLHIYNRRNRRSNKKKLAPSEPNCYASDSPSPNHRSSASSGQARPQMPERVRDSLISSSLHTYKRLFTKDSHALS